MESYTKQYYIMLIFYILNKNIHPTNEFYLNPPSGRLVGSQFLLLIGYELQLSTLEATIGKVTLFFVVISIG